VVMCVTLLTAEIATDSVPLHYFEVENVQVFFFIDLKKCSFNSKSCQYHSFYLPLVFEAGESDPSFSFILLNSFLSFLFQGFFTYLYMASILFLLYVFCYLLHEAACCGSGPPAPGSVGRNTYFHVRIFILGSSLNQNLFYDSFIKKNSWVFKKIAFHLIWLHFCFKIIDKKKWQVNILLGKFSQNRLRIY